MSAAVLGTNASFLFLTFLPPILWLIFYLHEDVHPEPKRLILLAFAGGMASALFAILGECIFINAVGGSCTRGFDGSLNPLTIFLGIAFIEEYVKYLAVRSLILRRKDFDEPVDAMIYMMTSAMGFAALENALFLFPLFRNSFFMGLEGATNRFLGANLLHALTSGLVGFFLARRWFHPKRRHFVIIGILIATLLHTLFNYLILVQDGTSLQGTFYLILLLSLMAATIFVDFERLKRQMPRDEVHM